MAEAVDFKYIGSRPVRPDGIEKVTGRAKFGADEILPSMIVGKVLRSPHAHASIRSIDTEQAKSIPGVFAVITGKDFPERAPGRGRGGFSENIIAGEKVLYHGHAIAAVAAQDSGTADAALAAIKVDYELLEPVLDPVAAMQPDAPILNPKQFTRSPNGTSNEPSNVSAHTITADRGDIEQGFSDADVVVERTFKTPMVHQGYIEPHACTANYTETGKATLWCATQGHFGVRSQTAGILGMDLHDLKVTASEIGGGFGGKTIIYLEPLALKLSQISHRPVRMAMTREEVFRATGPASGSVNTIKIGAKNDGTITAMSAKLIYEAGAYPGSPVGAGSMCVFAPYDVENVRIEGFDVIVNRPKVAAYRAPGAPQSMYASESVLDEIAQKIGMDPLELRMKNAAEEGTQSTYGPKFQAIGLKECIRRAMEHPNYKQPLGTDEGRGIAVGFWFNGGNQSSAEVHITDDGHVLVVEGSPDIGGSRASMALMAAETLGVPYDHVRVNVADTDSTGYCATTGGSRTTFATGLAVIQACENAIGELRKRAAVAMDLDIDQVEWSDGEAKPIPGVNVEVKSVSLAELAGAMARSGGPISGRASLTAQGPGPAFSVNMSDVKVDRETGRVTVKSFTSIQDAGKAIHPDYVEGQLQGGAAQGIGWALNEEYIYNQNGELDNAGFLDYRIPVASDLPMIDTEIVEVPNPNHPFGVRGCGETPIVAPLAAVGNAVSRALGRRFTELPMSPPKVLEELSDS